MREKREKRLIPAQLYNHPHKSTALLGHRTHVETTVAQTTPKQSKETEQYFIIKKTRYGAIDKSE